MAFGAVEELRSLKSAIDFKSQRALKAAEGGSAAVPLWKMHQLAREMNMTLEGVVQAKAHRASKTKGKSWKIDEHR